MSLLQLAALEFEKLLLTMLRIGGVMTVAPVFGHHNVPSLVKTGFIIIASIVILPTINTASIKLPPKLWAMSAILIKEVVAGLAFGFTSLLIFIAIQFAGNIIGLQTGFGIVNVIDPYSQQQVLLARQFQFFLAMLIFLSLNGHHLVMAAQDRISLAWQIKW